MGGWIMSQLNVDTILNSTATDLPDNLISKTPIAWGRVDGGSGSIVNSENIASVVKGGTGIYTINLSVTMANTNYIVVASASSTAGRVAMPNTFLTTSFVMNTFDLTPIAFDVDFTFLVFSEVAAS